MYAFLEVRFIINVLKCMNRDSEKTCLRVSRFMKLSGSVIVRFIQLFNIISRSIE